MGYECPWWRPTGGGGFGYDEDKRTLNYLAKAYGKMVYASAGTLHSIWGPNVIDQGGNEYVEIEVPDDSYDDKDALDSISAGDADGTSKKVKTKRVKATGVYSRYGNSTDPKYTPKAHLVSISTSGMDNLGIQEKATYSYKTYNGYQGHPPPSIGSKVGMSWGWAYGSKVLRGVSKSGQVVGWTVNSNMEGGYDITVDLLCTNASISMLAMAADQACAAISDPNLSDEAGKTLAVGGLLSALAVCADEAEQANAANPSVIFNNKLSGAIVEFLHDYTNPPAEGKEDASKKTYKAYIKFSSVVDLCNSILKEFNASVQIKFDKSSQTPIPVPPGLLSADPIELLTGGASAYGTLVCKAGTNYFNGFPADLYIGADYIINMIKTTNAIVINKQSGGGSTKFLSFKGFFDSIFSMFKTNLGAMYQLTCANSATKDDLTIYIVDFNNIEKVAKNTLGTVRSATCNAKLDGDEASVFYALKNPPTELKSLAAQGPAATSPTSNYGKHLADLGNLHNAGNVAAVRADNNNLVASKIPESSKYGIPSNWNLSVTTDGSSYKYGGVISHACVPESPLKGYDIGFAITSVNHSVSAGDWTTSLSTYSRIYKKK
jgi:hypothetical protein